MSKNQNWVERGQAGLIQNYGRLPIAMERGEGSWVWDADGRKHLDLFAGFGGCILGHCHPALVEAVSAQAKKLWHVGNLFFNEPQIEFAERLKKAAFDGRAFFCHSGAEANEAACKLARLRGSQFSPKRWKIITLEKSFHGRTLAMLAATGNAKYSEGFGPPVQGFSRVPGGDIKALEAAIDEETAGVLMEPIQGEGGMNTYPAEYPAQVRALCDQRQLTLIFDEVWCGCGRTGRWFAHQWFGGGGENGAKAGAGAAGVTPDIMTLGKAVGGGLPVGVMWARPELAKLLVPGTHGCTLGGNGLCMAAARTIFDVIEKEGLMQHALELGNWAKGELRGAAGAQEVRGSGLFLGLELKAPPEKLVERCVAAGLLVNLTAGKVIRLAPAINIPRAEWEMGVRALKDVLKGG